MVIGNKEVETWKHMANPNKDKAMCSGTKTTKQKKLETDNKDRTARAEP